MSPNNSQKNAQNEFNHFISFVKTLRLEGLTLAGLMVVLTYKSNQSLLYLPITFLFFDISALGYLLNKKIGALIYNTGHSSNLPTIILILGLLFELRTMQVFSYAWLFHIGIDRALGFGLKHKTSFKHTHLNSIPFP